MTSVLENKAADRKKLVDRIATAKKQAGAAKKAAKLAKMTVKQAKQKFKDTKRAAKKLRKTVKALEAELISFTAKTNPRKSSPRRSPKKRAQVAALPALTTLEPVASENEPPSDNLITDL
jgi:hypothetical protein